MQQRTSNAKAVYDELIARFLASAGEDPGARWQWLEAAHIVGQMDLRLHWHSHGAMLRFAVAQRDWPEAAGQVFRLALVPLGHALGRLPVGNTGRATVNAFRPMPVASPARERIGEARAALLRRA